jgi:hypothetical protein
VGYLSLDCKGERLLIELKHTTHYQTDEKVRCILEDQYIYLFDPETGARIV